MERRKDSKGRVLRKGEDERKDGRYQYRYTTYKGKRGYVYAETLQELFEKKRRRLNKTFETGLTMTQETSQSLK